MLDRALRLYWPKDRESIVRMYEGRALSVWKNQWRQAFGRALCACMKEERCLYEKNDGGKHLAEHCAHVWRKSVVCMIKTMAASVWQSLVHMYEGRALSVWKKMAASIWLPSWHGGHLAASWNTSCREIVAMLKRRLIVRGWLFDSVMPSQIQARDRAGNCKMVSAEWGASGQVSSSVCSR